MALPYSTDDRATQQLYALKEVRIHGRFRVVVSCNFIPSRYWLVFTVLEVVKPRIETTRVSC